MNRRVSVETHIRGACDSSFGGLKDAFRANFDAGLELGASLSVVVEGRVVADLWGGFLDPARSRRWNRNSLVLVGSCTKAFVAALTLMLVEDGSLDLDQPVSTWWPEFKREGKEGVLLRHLLNHQAGLPAIARDMPPGSLSDWELVIEALEETPPWWEPGTRHGYHAATFGHLVGEVLRRVSGRRVGELLRRRLAAPLALDLHLGLKDAALRRRAWMVSQARAPNQPAFFSGVKELGYRSLHNPGDYLDPDRINTPEFYRSEIPAAGGVTNARGLARFFGALAEGGVLDGSRILHPETVALANTVQSDGIDEVFKLPSRFGLGFQLTRPAWPFGPGARSFGHGGGGGSLGFADPDARVGFGYATNRLLWGPTRSDPRWAPLFDALYDALG